jgi:hypothetical protein
VASVRTDDRGRFVIRLASDDEFGLVAMDGRGLRSETIAPVAPGSTHLLTLHKLVTVTARIEAEADGLPISPAGMKVVASVSVRSGIGSIAYAPVAFGELETAMADATGRVTLHALEGSECRLRLLGTGAEAWSSSPPREEVVLAAKLVRRSLRVIDHLRAPIEGALVNLIAQGNHSPLETDAEGVVHLLAPTPAYVTVTADGYQWTTVLLNRPTVKIELEYAKPVTVRLRAGDTPLASRRLVTFGYARGSGTLMPCVREISTDATGEVELHGRGRSEGLIVWLEVPDGYRRILDVEKGTAREDLGTIDVAPIEHVGRILAADGSGASHVMIQPISITDPFGHEHGTGDLPHTFSDHAGRFRLVTSRTIRVDIAAMSELHVLGFARLPDRPDAAFLLQLSLDKDIGGVVVDSWGKPIEGQGVTLSCRTGDTAARYLGVPRRTATTDEFGRFRFHAIAAGEPHFLSVSRSGRNPTHDNLTVKPGETELVLTLPRSP